MRIIYPDQITVLAADEENAHYPATNLQDGYKKYGIVSNVKIASACKLEVSHEILEKEWAK